MCQNENIPAIRYCEVASDQQTNQLLFAAKQPAGAGIGYERNSNLFLEIFVYFLYKSNMHQP